MLKLKNGFNGERAITLPKMIIQMEEKDPLVSSLYITDIGYYPHAEHHYRERKTPITQNILIYCVDGAGYYEIDNHRYDIRENQYLSFLQESPICMLRMKAIPGRSTGFISAENMQRSIHKERWFRRIFVRTSVPALRKGIIYLKRFLIRLMKDIAARISVMLPPYCIITLLP